jgi:hypothetical protein
LIDRVDLLLLSVTEPLADAVCATVCRRWREATDLWLEVLRAPRHRTLSACCGLEASLRAGLYDLAQYFHIALEEDQSFGDFLAEPWRRSLPARRDRARFHADGTPLSGRAVARHGARRLLDLRLYREAVREILRGDLLEIEGARAVALLAECYFSLGEHEALIALYDARRPHFTATAPRAMLENAQACLEREARGPVVNALEFVRLHPAGALLNPFLQPPAPAFVSHG